MKRPKSGLKKIISIIEKHLRKEDTGTATWWLNEWQMKFPWSDDPEESLCYNYYRLKCYLLSIDISPVGMVTGEWLRFIIDFANDYFFLNAEAGYPHADKSKEIHKILTEDLCTLESGYFEHLIPLLHNPEESVEELLIELNLPKQHPALRKQSTLPSSGSKKE